ncbi:hypothetical protein EDF81_1546 [Enterobacter sp. BIGb0383]|uniref:hypothetical protein n=1 Tax=unclassified Enterobacter TaxID=2608935 RepID=UPI000FC247ED|nr:MULTISPECIES: hypothetical protein [unclassified Enterobacter]ROP63025.1 hypothetical protein EDF81_1546 [Enterobacter sp. BIGb0383]ROS13186.1 hypothetical protein EC848_1548 [Enterobacter sp. BIGb0359]
MDKSISAISFTPPALKKRGISISLFDNNESSLDIITNLKSFPDGIEDYSSQRGTVLPCGCGDEYCLGCGHDF